MQKIRTDLRYCDTVKFTNSTGSEIAAETMIKVGKLIGLTIQKAADGEESVLVYRVPPHGIEVPCPADATGVFAVGDAVYFDETNNQVVNNAGKSGNIFCGNAIEAAVQADTSVIIDLARRLRSAIPPTM